MCSEARFCITLSLITFIAVQSSIFTFRARCWGSRSRGSYIPDVSLFSVFCFFFRRGAVFLKLYSLQFVFLLFFSSFLLFFYSSYKIITFTSKLVREHNCLSSSLRNLKIRSNKTSKKVFGYLFFLLYFVCFLVKIK